MYVPKWLLTVFFVGVVSTGMFAAGWFLSATASNTAPRVVSVPMSASGDGAGNEVTTAAGAASKDAQLGLTEAGEVVWVNADGPMSPASPSEIQTLIADVNSAASARGAAPATAGASPEESPGGDQYSLNALLGSAVADDSSHALSAGSHAVVADEGSHALQARESVVADEGSHALHAAPDSMLADEGSRNLNAEPHAVVADEGSHALNAEPGSVVADEGSKVIDGLDNSVNDSEVATDGSNVIDGGNGSIVANQGASAGEAGSDSAVATGGGVAVNGTGIGEGPARQHADGPATIQSGAVNINIVAGDNAVVNVGGLPI